MWTAGLSITGTLLSLYAVGVSAQTGVKCIPKARGEVVNNELETNATQIAVELCESHFQERGHDPFIRKAGPGGYALTITHSEEDPNDVGVEECATYFNEIVEQCILDAGVWGGMAHVNGLMYEIFQDDTTHSSAESLGVRANAKPKEKPKKKTGTTGAGIDKKKKEEKKKSATTPTPKPKPNPKSSKGDACKYAPGGKDAKGKGGKGVGSKGSKNKDAKKISARGCSDTPPKNFGPEYYDSLDKSYLNAPDDEHVCDEDKIKRLRRSVNKVIYGAPLYRRSGHKYAKTWEDWQTILDVLDEELGKLAPAGKKIRIIWAGGMTALHLGLRGRDGKSGDIDFLYYFGTSEDDKAMFYQAIKNTYRERKQDLPGRVPEPSEAMQISNSMEQNSEGDISPERLEEWTRLSKKEKQIAYPGKHFEAYDGTMLFQVFGKMDKLYKARKKVQEQQIKDGYKYGKYDPKDEKDGQAFFKLWVEKNPKHIDDVIGYTMPIIAEHFKDHLAPGLKEVIQKEAVACREWEEKHPRQRKATKPPPDQNEIDKNRAKKKAQKIEEAKHNEEPST